MYILKEIWPTCYSDKIKIEDLKARKIDGNMYVQNEFWGKSFFYASNFEKLEGPENFMKINYANDLTVEDISDGYKLLKFNSYRYIEDYIEGYIIFIPIDAVVNTDGEFLFNRYPIESPCIVRLKEGNILKVNDDTIIVKNNKLYLEFK